MRPGDACFPREQPARRAVPVLDGEEVPHGTPEASLSGEFAFLERLRLALPTPPPGQVGLGDDTAVLDGGLLFATDVLTVMFRHPTGKMYRESLSIAGQDGTIAKRMLDLKGRVFAKTGYIGGVRSLSGYIQTRSSRWLCFSIVYNQVPGPVKAFEDLQDEAVHVPFDYREN